MILKPEECVEAAEAIKDIFSIMARAVEWRRGTEYQLLLLQVVSVSSALQRLLEEWDSRQ